MKHDLHHSHCLHQQMETETEVMSSHTRYHMISHVLCARLIIADSLLIIVTMNSFTVKVHGGEK